MSFTNDDTPGRAIAPTPCGSHASRLDGPGVSWNKKEKRNILLCAHLSYSYIITHFVVIMYCLLIMTGTELSSGYSSLRKTYLHGWYTSSVIVNSGISPVIYWVYHTRFRQQVRFYFYKIGINACLVFKKICRCC